VEPSFYDAVLAPELSRVVAQLGLAVGPRNYVPRSVTSRLESHIREDVAWFRELGVDLPAEYDHVSADDAAPLEPYCSDVGRMGAALLLTSARDALRARRSPALIAKATGVDRTLLERLGVIERALDRLVAQSGAQG
jgi:hypothetical protein